MRPHVVAGAESVTPPEVRQMGLEGKGFKIYVIPHRPAKRLIAGEGHYGQLGISPGLGVHIRGKPNGAGLEFQGQRLGGAE